MAVQQHTFVLPRITTQYCVLAVAKQQRLLPPTLYGRTILCAVKQQCVSDIPFATNLLPRVWWSGEARVPRIVHAFSYYGSASPSIMQQLRFASLCLRVGNNLLTRFLVSWFGAFDHHLNDP